MDFQSNPWCCHRKEKQVKSTPVFIGDAEWGALILYHHPKCGNQEASLT